jgi:hypothetical protein
MLLHEYNMYSPAATGFPAHGPSGNHKMWKTSAWIAASANCCVTALKCHEKIPACKMMFREAHLAVKANQATITKEIECYFAKAPPDQFASMGEIDKGHGRMEERTVMVSAETFWLEGHRRSLKNPAKPRSMGCRISNRYSRHIAVLTEIRSPGVVGGTRIELVTPTMST